MIDAGLDDVLVPYNIVGAPKLERLSELLRRAPVAVSVDDAGLLDGLEGAAGAAARELAVLVDCDTGLGRTGVQSPQAAVALAAEVERRESLRFEGFVTYPAPEGTEAFFAEAVEVAHRRELRAAIVSAGGTPAMWDADRLRPAVTEYRAGTYAFHDRNTIAAGAATPDDAAARRSARTRPPRAASG
jgi:D-serine deaminase-like pyridoxal phosphate-dependent protein